MFDAAMQPRQVVAAVIASRQAALRADEYARDVIRRLAAITGSEFCIWLGFKAGQMDALCWTLGSERYLPTALLYGESAPMIANLARGSLVVAPMMFRSQTAGVLVLGNRPGGYEPADLRMLTDTGKIAVAQYESLRCAEECGFSPRENSKTAVADLIHDLRQPLSMIDISAYFLEMILSDHDKGRAQVQSIRIQVEEANRLLENLMERLRSQRNPGGEAEGEESRSFTNSAMAAVTY